VTSHISVKPMRSGSGREEITQYSSAEEGDSCSDEEIFLGMIASHLEWPGPGGKEAKRGAKKKENAGASEGRRSAKKGEENTPGGESPGYEVQYYAPTKFENSAKKKRFNKKQREARWRKGGRGSLAGGSRLNGRKEGSQTKEQKGGSGLPRREKITRKIKIGKKT